jgi:hypothetical protein
MEGKATTDKATARDAASQDFDTGFPIQQGCGFANAIAGGAAAR